MSFDQLDINSVIPSGNDLRVLLNSDHISYGEIHKLLQEKGIYIWDSDKSVTVPLLCSTLLLPDEFTRLIEASITRESKPKNKKSSVELVNSSKDWTDCIRDLIIDDTVLPNKGIDIIKFDSSPFIEVENSNSVKITYSITNKKYNEDWIKSELKFNAEIRITNNKGKLQLDFYSTHTSKETDSINRNIIKVITQTLYKDDCIQRDELNQICFKSFNNQERVIFFKRLTSGLKRKFSNGDVDNIEITFDQSIQNIADNPQITWMKKAVKKLKIDGERLHEIFLISDNSYYEHYYIQKMDIEYPFKIGTNNGKCKICFFFSAPTKKEEDYLKSELTFSFIKASFETDPNKDAKKEVIEAINLSVQEMIDNSYQLTLKDRNNRFIDYLNKYSWSKFDKNLNLFMNNIGLLNLFSKF